MTNIEKLQQIFGEKHFDAFQKKYSQNLMSLQKEKQAKNVLLYYWKKIGETQTLIEIKIGYIQKLKEINKQKVSIESEENYIDFLNDINFEQEYIENELIVLDKEINKRLKIFRRVLNSQYYKICFN